MIKDSIGLEESESVKEREFAEMINAMKLDKPILPEELRDGATIIAADPPWRTNQTGKRGAAQKYPLMTTEKIKAMPVEKLAAKDSLLALWCFNSNIQEALDVMKAWRFRYVTKFTWIKMGRLGLGNLIRNCDETLLLGVRGHFKTKYHSQPSWGVYAVMDHSTKPFEIFPMLQRLAGNEGPFIELFARRKTPAWFAWGNQLAEYGGADFVIPGYPVPEYSNLVKEEVKRLNLVKEEQ